MQITDEILDTLADHSPEQAEMVAQIRAGREAHARELVRAEAEGDWHTAVALQDSQERAPVLLRALRASDDDTARQLLADWFNSTDSFGALAPEFRKQFMRLEFTTDDLDGKLPDFPVQVYRAQWGNDPPPREALSWTARRDVAERFAHYLTGPRARFVLGIFREDDKPVIWEATAHEALGWFVSRDEEEIVPKRITDLRMIAELIRAEEEDDA
jgi:hypothetical protein